MHTINVIDPRSGKAHEIPYDQLPDALEAGGEFADETQKQKAIAIQDGTWKQSEVAPSPFNPKESELAETPFNGMPPPPPERTGIPGVAKDLAHALSQGAKGVMKFAHDIPDNLEKSGKDLEAHPLSGQAHILGQLGAGAANVAKAAINSPHDLLKYMLKKHLAFDIPLPGQQYYSRPTGLSDIIPHIPEDTGVEKALGLEAQPERGDELTRAIPELVAGAAGLKGLVGAGRKILKAPDLKQAIRDTQSKVNAADSRTGKVFDKIESEVGKRGIGKVALDPEVIENAESLLVGSKANKALIAKAKTGDYVALRKLQSDLRVKAEKALASDLKAENDIGDLMDETRQDINQGIANHLKEAGHEDLAKALKQARNEYRDIKQTYFSNPALSKVFGESQVVPKNPMTLLTEESTEMKRFMSKHPEVEKMLAKALKHKSRKNVGLSVLGGLGVGGTAGTTYKYLTGK